MNDKPKLSERAEVLLKFLVERYISGGQPVSSRALAREAGLDLSPATVRNVMADLEDMGFIKAPHTSAGRVPTPRGYRVFVDYLLKVRPLDTRALQQIENRFSTSRDPQQVLATAGDLLSQITHLAGMVTPPRLPDAGLRQLEFLSLSRDRILAILVTDDGRVQNRVISTERGYTPSELVEAANYFNEKYAGRSLQDVRRSLLLDLERDTAEMHRTMSAATEMARQVFDSPADGADDDLMVSGERNLFDVPELCDVNKLRQLFDAFKAKQDLLHLLDKSMRAKRVQIFIGEESGYEMLTDCSVVAAPYEVDGRVVGTLGVIGPVRMSYEDVIPVVDVTARLLGSALRG
jgi:heat-inducible transcriptional repressor